MSVDIDHRRLDELLAAHQIDQVLALVSLEDIIETWLLDHLADHDRGVDDPFFWAVELEMSDEFRRREEDFREFLRRLVEAAPDDQMLGSVGAGPLEDFISSDESRLRWIEKQAAASPRFRQALSHVYVWGWEPNHVAERVERAAGVRLARPREWSGP